MQIKRFFQLIFTGIILVLSLLTAPSAKAQTSLETELLNVMRGKSAAFYAADTVALQKYWIKDAHSSRSSVNKFEFSEQIGWEDVIARFKKDIQETGQVDTTLPTFDNVHIRTSGNMAFVEADEHWRWPNNDSLVTTVHTYAVLMQENKAWKVTNQIRVVTDTYVVNAITREMDLNTIGYDLLKEKRVSEAIELFAFNVKLNPTSWNTYDSLGEAYALAGNKKLAIANYGKSLELNPENEAGKKALTILKQN